MENVTDEVSNPFGMSPPCPRACEGGHRAVLGYGDANADVHAIGDHPGVHGGGRTGVPFTGIEAGERVLSVLAAVGLLGGRDPPAPENCYLSYLHPCCPPDGEDPSAAEYRDFERFLDAELRAIAADILVPVGGRAIEYVLAEHTARGPPDDPGGLHATEVRGRGFLIVPVGDPREWGDGDRRRIVTALADLLATDYRRVVDLGRFLPGGDPYFVR